MENLRERSFSPVVEDDSDDDSSTGSYHGSPNNEEIDTSIGGEIRWCIPPFNNASFNDRGNLN